MNFDGVVDASDWKLVQRRRGCDFPAGWKRVLDMDSDVDLDRTDMRLLFAAAFPATQKTADAASLLSRKRHRWFVRR